MGARNTSLAIPGGDLPDARIYATPGGGVCRPGTRGSDEAAGAS
jgi:hypothetical protein